MLNQNVANKTNEVKDLALVFVSNKEVMTDSLIVAKLFEKGHHHVMRDIRRILNDTENIFNAPTFGLVDYYDKKGEKRKKHIFGKDAAILLIMGYTGEKAMGFKIDYINAFNGMSEMLLHTASLEEELRVTRKLDQMSFDGASDAGRVLRQRGIDKPIFKAKIESLEKQLQLPLDIEPEKIAH